MITRALGQERRADAVDARSAASAAVAAGLVPSTTSGNGAVSISFDKAIQRETRIKALRKNVWAAGTLINQQKDRGFRCWFVTLTYRGVDDWKPAHLSDAMRRFRHWCKGLGFAPSYVWVAELQQRGAMHYHLAVWLPSHVSMPMWDKSGRGRSAFWQHGMTNRQLARNAVGYLMKYMSKIGKHHEYPKGARVYGAGGLTEPNRKIRSWLNWPQWLKQTHGVGEVVRRGGVRVVRETGEILEAAFVTLRTVGGLLLLPVRPLPTRWADGPYSSWTAA